MKANLCLFSSSEYIYSMVVRLKTLELSKKFVHNTIEQYNNYIFLPSIVFIKQMRLVSKISLELYLFCCGRFECRANTWYSLKNKKIQLLGAIVVSIIN